MKKPVANSRKPVERDMQAANNVRRRLLLVAAGFWVLASSSSLPAQPTQEEVFKSIGDTVNEPLDTSRVVAVVAAIGGVVVLLVVVGQWRKRDPKSRSLDHPGKLLKEVMRNVPLKGAELKQIKILSQEVRPRGADRRVDSPLTLLLCPSLLGEAAKQSRGKADLPVVAGLVKKLVGRA
jgi:hypothetical protein